MRLMSSLDFDLAYHICDCYWIQSPYTFSMAGSCWALRRSGGIRRHQAMRHRPASRHCGDFAAVSCLASSFWLSHVDEIVITTKSHQNADWHDWDGDGYLKCTGHVSYIPYLTVRPLLRLIWLLVSGSFFSLVFSLSLWVILWEVWFHCMSHCSTFQPTDSELIDSV